MKKMTVCLLMPAVAAAVLALALPVLASQADLDAERAMYIEAFKSTNLETVESKARNMEWSGWSDPAIFDPLEQKILANMNVQDKYGLDSVAWMIRALGSSGNQKYAPTLNKVLNEGHKKLQRHAKNALEALPQFAVRNPVISKDLGKSAAGRVGEQRILNLLNSGKPELVYAGIDRAYDFHSKGPAHDKELMDKLNQMLLASYKTESGDRYELNAKATMCKALANTANPAYKPTMQAVADDAADRKLRKYASKYLRYFP